MTKEIVIIANYSQQEPLSFDDLCDACRVPSEVIYDFIEYEIIYPIGSGPDDWEFDLSQLQRVKTALRLQRDLELNLADIVLVLELLDKIDRLEAQRDLLERLLK